MIQHVIKLLVLKIVVIETTANKLLHLRLARGTTALWKQPMAYCIINESCLCEIINEKLFETITEISSTDLNVYEKPYFVQW